MMSASPAPGRTIPSWGAASSSPAGGQQVAMTDTGEEKKEAYDEAAVEMGLNNDDSDSSFGNKEDDDDDEEEDDRLDDTSNTSNKRQKPKSKEKNPFHKESQPAKYLSKDANKKQKTTGKFDCQQHYEQTESHKKPMVLLAMCIGSKADNSIFGDTAADSTYKDSKKKKKFSPTSDDLRDECKRVKRRHIILHPNQGQLRCISKGTAWTKRWLIDHPITDPDDLKFIWEEEEKFQALRELLASLHSPLILPYHQYNIHNVPL